jgi:hypothetical protein
MPMSRVIVVSVLLCISQLFAQPQSAITGQVTDSEGAVIAKARVLLHWDPSGSTAGLTDNIGATQDISVLTDDSGKYSASVPSGFYDVFVTATGFTPTAAKVRVKRDNALHFSTKLRADPLVGKELGDEFDTAPKKR